MPLFRKRSQAGHDVPRCQNRSGFTCGGKKTATSTCSSCGIALCSSCVKIDRLGDRRAYCSLCFIEHCF